MLFRSLDLLAVVAVGSATFHALMNLIILLVFELIAIHSLPITLLWLPIVWIPLILGSLAFTWILSAAGVFLRDIGQIIAVALNMLMFLSPIFYPSSALPPRWQPILRLNPLAQIIEQTRRVVLKGLHPDYTYLVIGILLSVLACQIGYRLFQKSKRAFADVL